MEKEKPLTIREAEFVTFIADSGSHTYNNVKQSYKRAYINSSDKAAESNGIRLIRKDKIIRAIRAYKAKIMDKMILTREEVLADLEYGLQLAKKTDDLASIARFSELRGKTLAMYTEKHITEDVTDSPRPEDALSESENKIKLAKSG